MLGRLPVITLTLLALLASGCAGATKELAPRGAACETREDCRDGLVCKGARCEPPRSEAGGVCVTAGGCRDGLVCVSGRCAASLAGPDECAPACARLRALMAGEMAAAGEDAETPEAGAALEALERDCMGGCVGRLSVERARCLADAEDLEAVQACP